MVLIYFFQGADSIFGSPADITYVEMRSCNIDIALSSDYSAIEEKERWMAVVKKKGIDLESLLIISCEENITRTTNVRTLMESNRFQGRPIYEPKLIEVNDGLTAVVFTGEIEFRNKIVRAPVVYFDTRRMNYYFFLVPLIEENNNSISELSRIASGIRFRTRVHPAISEDELNARKFVLFFLLFVTIVGAGSGWYYKKRKSSV